MKVAVGSALGRRAACLFAAATAFCPNTQPAAAFDFDAAVAAADAEQRLWCGMVKCVKEYPPKAFDVAGVKPSGEAPPLVDVSRFTGVKEGTPSLIKINLKAATPADGTQLIWLAEQSSGVVLAASTAGGAAAAPQVGECHVWRSKLWRCAAILHI